MTAKEKVLKRVRHWSEAQAERALRAAEGDAQAERRAIGEAIAAGYRRFPQTADEGAWAMANAREAIREEPW